MTCKRVLFWGVLLAVLTPPALGAQAEPDCAAWNTSEYFETATPEDVTACLAAGANVSARGTGQRTPLHQAALYNQNPMVIQVLLAAGADPMARDESEKTPLHLATQQNSVAVIEFLLSKGTPPPPHSVGAGLQDVAHERVFPDGNGPGCESLP